jgi:hypothetical protein
MYSTEARCGIGSLCSELTLLFSLSCVGQERERPEEIVLSGTMPEVNDKGSCSFPLSLVGNKPMVPACRKEKGTGGLSSGLG